MISKEVSLEQSGEKIRFELNGVSTGWMDTDDPFIERIDSDNINRTCPERHLMKEIEVKNLLDEGVSLLKSGEYKKAIESFDEVLFYDLEYGEALIGKSHALFGQRHYVKALRYYRRSGTKDTEYHRMLLEKSSEERDHFPKFRQYIYAGDEHFSIGDYENALKNYKKALANPSKQKEKILFKLYNKIASTCLKLNDFENGLKYFNESLNQLNNDYAWYGKGVCEYELGLDGCGGSLANAVDIKKDQLLEKGLIQNELGLYDEAIKTFDCLLDNHFKEDEMYVSALNGKMLAMRKMGYDLTEINEVFDLL